MRCIPKRRSYQITKKCLMVWASQKNIRSSYMLIPMYPRWLRQSGTLCSASVTRRRKRLRNLYGYYSNEPVKGLTPWVSPVMVVPKWNDEIRLCVDMRRANVTIIRECYPIATMDEVLQSLNWSTVFSMLDLKSGYHELELHPDSYSITTFIIQCGLLQYKHL